MKKDLRILNHLRQDARQSLVSISRKTKIPVSTVFERIKQQEKMIKKYTAILDFPALGYNIRANFLVKERSGVRSLLLDHPNVNSVFQVNGDYDFLADCVFRLMADLKCFMDELDKINAEREVYYVIDEIKREDFLGVKK